MFKSSVAVREKVKLMVGLTGPSGAGKTYSALQLAYGITGDWKRIALADTENRSALYYAGEKTGEWEHIDFPSTMPQGYHPNNWLKLINYVESLKHIEVLILDSITHEWEGSGGALELVDSAAGNKFANGWKVVTPLHRAFIDKIRHSRLHVLATIRSKQDYVVELDGKGKSVPKKVGTKSVQREGTDYEFGIIFDIDMNHYATASKDRTGVFAPIGPFKIGASTGAELMKWANSGKEPEKKEDEPKPKGFDPTNEKQVKWLTDRLAELKVHNDKWDDIGVAMVGKRADQLETIVTKFMEA
jgi:hypothetical protein